MNDLESNGFLVNRSYESNERTGCLGHNGHRAVYTNYVRDLLSLFKYRQ
jgi:hypothetical protein